MTRNVGKYQLVRKLATGGMAEVYLARAAGPRGFEKSLVVKCILPHLKREPSFVEMFHAEARLAARLTHPHVVQIFDFGEADGSYFIAMEYVDGPSLRTLIKRASAQRLLLPPEVCARLISQACEGLAFAHDFVDADSGRPLGLIHRDVSPDNLLVSLQGSVKVVDFGIAKVTDQERQTRSGAIKGKLAYMPPEQLQARPLDRRVDVYALGMVLYELLTLRRPYAAASEAALMHAILFDEPLPAECHRAGLPEPLRRILARAMAKEREQRYPDCHALQADLEAFILSEGRLVTAHQVAQLVQRVTAEPVPPVPCPSSEAEPPVREAEPRTELDTSPATMRAEPGARTREAPRFWSGTATRESAPATAASGEDSAPPPPRPERAPHWRPSRWTQRAIEGSVLLLLLAGLVWEARSRSGNGLMKAGVALAPIAQAEPTPPAPAPVPAPAPAAPEVKLVGAVGGSGAVEVPAPAPRPVAATPKVRPASTRPRSARALTSTRSATVAMGKLDVRAHPYAEVSVDGRGIGTTPLDAPLELSVGTHTVKFFNPPLARTEIRRVEVKEGETTPLTVSFPRAP